MYLALFETILADFFRTFGLPLRFLLLKPSFLHGLFTTQHSDFPRFLAVSTTDKPVNRSIHAYSLVFALRGFIFRDIHKKTRKEFEQFGLQTTKIMWLENIIAHAHLWRGCTQIEYSSQTMAASMKRIRLKDTTFGQTICLPRPIVLKYRLLK